MPGVTPLFFKVAVIVLFAEPSKDTEPVTSPDNVMVLAVESLLAAPAGVVPDLMFAISEAFACALLFALSAVDLAESAVSFTSFIAPGIVFDVVSRELSVFV